ncbi:MAG: DUF4349 domain-containing protein, partial [Chloroflexi bacterium]|nr:DUF4349 domain-containing protein [Chloroflexota bacterium]
AGAALAVPTPTPAPRPPSSLSFDSAASGASGAAVAPQAEDRKIIAQASLTVQVDAVAAAVAQVQGIAQGAGGYVEYLSSSGAGEKQYATITIRVPQSEFYRALDQLRALGEVQGENLGSQDVTEQFIDLEARLRSAKREEESLLALLGRAEQISEILTIERELSRVRADIERYQGQLNALENRVALSSITVSLVPPATILGQPPAGSLTVEVDRAQDSAEAVKSLAARLGGEVDSFFISVRDGRTRADISLRVFSKDFTQAIANIEDEGKVLVKEVREGKPGDEAAEKPDAPVTVSLVEPAQSTLKRILTIGLWVGSGALVVLAGLLVYGVYRLGRSRGMAAAQ